MKKFNKKSFLIKKKISRWYNNFYLPTIKGIEKSIWFGDTKKEISKFNGILNKIQ